MPLLIGGYRCVCAQPGRTRGLLSVGLLWVSSLTSMNIVTLFWCYFPWVWPPFHLWLSKFWGSRRMWGLRAARERRSHSVLSFPCSASARAGGKPAGCVHFTYLHPRVLGSPCLRQRPRARLQALLDGDSNGKGAGEWERGHSAWAAKASFMLVKSLFCLLCNFNKMLNPV